MICDAVKCPKRRRHRLCAFVRTRTMQAPCKRRGVYFSNRVKTVTSNTHILWKGKLSPLEMVTIWKPGRKCQYDASMCRIAVHDRVGVSAAAKISKTRRRLLSCPHHKPKRTPVSSLWCVCMPRTISKYRDTLQSLKPAKMIGFRDASAKPQLQTSIAGISIRFSVGVSACGRIWKQSKRHPRLFQRKTIALRTRTASTVQSIERESYLLPALDKPWS